MKIHPLRHGVSLILPSQYLPFWQKLTRAAACTRDIISNAPAINTINRRDVIIIVVVVVNWTGSNANMPRGPAQLLQESLTILFNYKTDHK